MQNTKTAHTALKAAALTLIGLAPSQALADWSGTYAGLSLGSLTKGEGTSTFAGEDQTAQIEGDFILGGFAGVQRQLGTLVYGGELEFGRANDFEIINDDDNLDRDFNLIDLKARIGNDLGDALIYGVAGLSYVKAFGDFEGEDTAQGFNIGFGLDYKINDQFTFGAEYLARRVVVEDEIDFDVDFETLALRAAMHF